MLSPDKIRKYGPFKGFSEEQLNIIANHVRSEEANKGTLLFKRGKNLDRQYFLIEGEVNLIDNQFGAEKVQEGSERATQPLNVDSPTSVSAIAKSFVRFFHIETAIVEECIKAYAAALPELASVEDGALPEPEIQEDDNWMTALLELPLFNRVPMAQLQEIFKKFEKVVAHEGEVIIKEGAEGDYFYVLASGTALVANRTGSVDIELGTGDYFGEEALVSDSKRNATVTMTSDGVLERLNADDFKYLLKDPVITYVDMAGLKDITQPYKLLDVKMPIEFRMSHLPGSINIPISRLRNSLDDLANTQTYVITDDAGPRAEAAAHILCQNGFNAVILRVPAQEGEVEDSEEKIA